MQHTAIKTNNQDQPNTQHSTSTLSLLHYKRDLKYSSFTSIVNGLPLVVVATKRLSLQQSFNEFSKVGCFGGFLGETGICLSTAS